MISVKNYSAETKIHLKFQILNTSRCTRTEQQIGAIFDISSRRVHLKMAVF